MIVYKAPKEQHVITVFTDITCGYCRKLHEQMADYNALGITVRYRRSRVKACTASGESHDRHLVQCRSQQSV